MSMELERTKHTNRQLVLQHCKRPNLFNRNEESPTRSPQSATLRRKLREGGRHGSSDFSNARISVRLLGEGDPMPLAI